MNITVQLFSLGLDPVNHSLVLTEGVGGEIITSFPAAERGIPSVSPISHIKVKK